jgi:hypothetical protein
MSKQNETVHVELTMGYDLPLEQVEAGLAAKDAGGALIKTVKLCVPSDEQLYDFQIANVRTALGKYFVEKRVAELRQLPEHSSAEAETEIV